MQLSPSFIGCNLVWPISCTQCEVDLFFVVLFLLVDLILRNGCKCKKMHSNAQYNPEGSILQNIIAFIEMSATNRGKNGGTVPGTSYVKRHW